MADRPIAEQIAAHPDVFSPIANGQ
jgi:hypothetical protein